MISCSLFLLSLSWSYCLWQSWCTLSTFVFSLHVGLWPDMAVNPLCHSQTLWFRLTLCLCHGNYHGGRDELLETALDAQADGWSVIKLPVWWHVMLNYVSVCDEVVSWRQTVIVHQCKSEQILCYKSLNWSILRTPNIYSLSENSTWTWSYPCYTRAPLTHLMFTATAIILYRYLEGILIHLSLNIRKHDNTRNTANSVKASDAITTYAYTLHTYIHIIHFLSSTAL